MEISFKNKNKNSTFRPLQNMICYVTNWRIINEPLKLELYLSNFRVYFHSFFRLRCQMKNQWNNLFCIKSSRQASDCSDFPQSSFQTETNFIAGDHAFFVIANVFFVRRFYFAQMFGKNSPFFVAV